MTFTNALNILIQQRRHKPVICKFTRRYHSGQSVEPVARKPNLKVAATNGEMGRRSIRRFMYVAVLMILAEAACARYEFPVPFYTLECAC